MDKVVQNVFGFSIGRIITRKGRIQTGTDTINASWMYDLDVGILICVDYEGFVSLQRCA